MHELTVTLKPPFSWELSTGIWQRHPLEQVDVVQDGRYSRMFIRRGQPVLVHWEPLGTVEKPELRLRFDGAFDPEEDLSWVMDETRWIFHDHAPLPDFYEHASRVDPVLGEAAQELYGLKPVLGTSVFEILVFAIVGQQVTVAFAYQLKHALERAFACRATVDGKEWVCGLRPEDFPGATVEHLRQLKISTMKARAILELAEHFRMIPIDRHTLAGMQREDIEEALTALRGIGPWTARYTLIRALGLQDALPSGDAGLQNAVRRFYGLDEKPDARRLEELAEPWRPYRSLATYYLWTWSGQAGGKSR